MTLDFAHSDLGDLLRRKCICFAEFGRMVGIPLCELSTDMQNLYFECAGSENAIFEGESPKTHLWLRFTNSAIRRIMSWELSHIGVFEVPVVMPSTQQDIEAPHTLRISFSTETARLYQRAVFSWLLVTFPAFYTQSYNPTNTRKVRCVGPGRCPQQYTIQICGNPGVFRVHYLCMNAIYNESVDFILEAENIAKLIDGDAEKVLHLRVPRHTRSELYKANIILSDELSDLYLWYSIVCWRYVVNRYGYRLLFIDLEKYTVSMMGGVV